MAFVSESLDDFLNEVNRGEDAWANRQIDNWEKGSPDEPTGEQDPFDSSYDPEISSIGDVQAELAKLENREMSGEEFTNLCSWLGDQGQTLNPEALMTVFKMFLQKNNKIVDDLFSGGETYARGIEILSQKLGVR